MSVRVIDVLVVGGGPAGLAAGIRFGRAGLRTVVCERRSLPADKPCGEGVMPTGVRHLRRLGVSSYLRPEHMRPFVGIHYITATGPDAAARFAEGPGWGIRRTELSRALCERVGKIEAVELRPRTEVTLGARGPSGTRVWLEGRETIARLVVGADGLGSQVRRWAGLQGTTRRTRRFAIQQHFRCRPWSDFVEVHWTDGVEAYVTPCGPQEVGVAFLWAPERTALRGGPSLIRSMLAHFPRLRESLEGVEPAGAPRSIGPLHQVVLAPVSDGVALVGDASGYLDAITGEGISLALAQVQALCDTVVPWLLASNRAPLARDLQGYSQRIRAMIRQHHRITRLVLFFSQRPAFANRAVAILREDPALFRWLLSANMGEASLNSVPRPAVARLATALVHR